MGQVRLQLVASLSTSRARAGKFASQFAWRRAVSMFASRMRAASFGCEITCSMASEGFHVARARQCSVHVLAYPFQVPKLLLTITGSPQAIASRSEMDVPSLSAALT